MAGLTPERLPCRTPNLQSVIEGAWDQRDRINAETRGEIRDAVETALAQLDKGEARVAVKQDGEWVVNQWLKKAVLLSFRLNDMGLIAGAPGGSSWWDKVPSKFAGMSAEAFRSAGLPGRAGRRRAPLGLYRAGRGSDALVRQSRRLRRQRNHGRYVGNRRLVRPDRQERAPVGRRRHRRRAGAAAGQSRPSSRTTASSAPAPRWWRA